MSIMWQVILTLGSWVATLAVILSYYIVTSKTKKMQLKFLILTLIASILFIIYYLSIGAYSGATLNFILAVITLNNYRSNKDE